MAMKSSKCRNRQAKDAVCKGGKGQRRSKGGKIWVKVCSEMKAG